MASHYPLEQGLNHLVGQKDHTLSHPWLAFQAHLLSVQFFVVVVASMKTSVLFLTQAKSSLLLIHRLSHLLPLSSTFTGLTTFQDSYLWKCPLLRADCPSHPLQIVLPNLHQSPDLFHFFGNIHYYPIHFYYTQSFLIFHGFHGCKFSYFLKFICNPKINIPRSWISKEWQKFESPDIPVPSWDRIRLHSFLVSALIL